MSNYVIWNKRLGFFLYNKFYKVVDWKGGNKNENRVSLFNVKIFMWFMIIIYICNKYKINIYWEM